jgi:hypothetical protein
MRARADLIEDVYAGKSEDGEAMLERVRQLRDQA